MNREIRDLAISLFLKKIEEVDKEIAKKVEKKLRPRVV